MDFKDQPESIQHTITFDEDITEKRQIIRLPVQQAALVVPEHERKSYPTDLTDAQWQRIAPLLPPGVPNGHQHQVEPREIVNGILYVVCGSHDWRSFPPALPPRGTVYSYFRQWQRDGTLQRIIDALCSEEYEAAGREEPAGAAPGDAVAGEAQSGAAYDLTVVIPTRNERDNIVPLLHALRAALDGMRAEMIFVDDSDDDTPEVIKDAAAMETALFHVHLEHRQQGVARAGGLATAVVHGMNRAQAEYVAVIDADLQHPPEQLRVLYNQAVAQHADLVVASRYIKGGSYRGLAGVGRRWISIGLKWTARLLFPEHLLRVSDPLGGFFLLRRALLANVSLRPIGYKILLEILLRCPWRHVLEVPYQFQARAAGQSKATMRQGILALRHMLRLWCEVPAAGRVWKISLLVLLNALLTLTLFMVNNSFPPLWATLSKIIFGVMACLDFVLFNSFLFPSPNKASLQAIAIPTTPIIEANTDRQFEVMRYAEWLATEAKRTNNGSHQEESKKYAEDALKTVTVKSQEFRPFAPFRHALSASKTLTRGQAVVLSTIMLGGVLSLLFYGIRLVTLIIAMITLLYLSSLLLDFLLVMLALNQSTDEQSDEAVVHVLADAEWPQYTILCPLYREVEVVPQFVHAMQALDYPADKLQILFLTEEDDVETRRTIAAMHLPQHFSIVTVPAGQPRTKPRACNFGLLQATGDYLVIYDAEDIPDPLQLKKAVLAFANHDSDLACVQAKLNYYNTKQNLLTRWFTVEYSLWFDLMLPGMQQMKLPLPLGGTSNHFRMEMLHRIGAWDPFNVTEDCDLGLRLARSGLKTIVLDSTTYEEANSQVKNWIRQRSRWIKGYLLTYLVYMRQPLHYLRQGRLREFLSLQLVIGGKTAVLFVNPLMWALLAIYILFRPILGDVYHALFPAPVLYMGTLCLIFGNFLYIYSHLVGCIKRHQYGLIKWALFIPVYWVMMSIAASLALYQLIFKPHYWEKTKHGLHLHASSLFSGSTTVEEEHESAETMLSPALKRSSSR